MQRLLRSGQGPTLPRSLRSVTARGLRLAVLGIGGLALIFALAALGAFFFLLGSGSINVEGLNPRLARSLEERLGARYAVAIGPTF